MSLAGKTVLVTAGAQGIGRAVVERLVADGARVCVVDLDAEAVRLLCDRLGRAVEGIADDVRDDRVRDDALRRMRDCFGPVDVLVNNAGIMVRTPLGELALDDFRAALEVGPTAALRFTQALAGDLAGREGAVVNICSTRAHMSERDTESYAAAKGALLALTHALAVSLGPAVRVNAVSPGWIDVSGAGPGREPEPLDAEDHAQHPAGRVGRPEDVAELVALLLDRDRSGFVTGAELIADGGMTRRMIYAE